jgi:F-type H+-transporting ATPase subunit gamma
MCGQFNNDIVSFALKQLNDLVSDPRNNFIISVGSRVHPILAAENQKIDQRFTHPGSVQGITPGVQHLILYIEEWILRSGVNRVLLFYNKKETGSSYRPKMLHIYPLNKDWLFEINRQKWPGKSLPNMYMDWRAILSVLTRQYFFVSLYTAFAESLASENASRLAAMQAAEKNIDERLQDLSSRYNHVRQSSITSELLDMAAGFEALEGGTEG